MASYILYTYQFEPLSNENKKLFQSSLPTISERMDRKQEYLNLILSNSNFKFKSAKEGGFEHLI